MSGYFLAECRFTDSSPVSLRRYGLKIASKMGFRKKLKNVVVTALLLGLIALFVMTIILLTSKSEQDGSEILLRIQESSTTTAIPQTTEIEIFLGCFNVSNNVSVLLDSCHC